MAQPYIGEIRMFAGNFAPAGWALCNGQAIPISENDTLFNLIGTTYGGDGESTFNLPNLQSRIPIHMGAGPAGVVYQLAEMAGTESETLTVQQIPNHTHPLVVSGQIGSVSDPSQNLLSESPNIKIYTAQDPSAAMNLSAVASVGGSQPHENTQPFLVVTYIISLFGIFPSQT